MNENKKKSLPAANKINSAEVLQFKTDLQRKCVAWSKRNAAQYPLLKMMFHPGSDKIKTLAESARLAQMGIRKGLPRLIVPVPSVASASNNSSDPSQSVLIGKRYNGLAVEIKHPQSGLCSEQISWINALNENGYLCEIISSLEEFKSAVARFHYEA